MPRNKPKKGRDVSPDWKANLINVDFSHDMQKDFLKWDEGKNWDGSAVYAKLSELVSDGWKLSFSFSSYYDCHVMSLTDKEAGTAVDGKTLMLKHVNFDRLVPLACYVIDVLLENSHPDLMPDTSMIDW